MGTWASTPSRSARGPPDTEHADQRGRPTACLTGSRVRLPSSSQRSSTVAISVSSGGEVVAQTTQRLVVGAGRHQLVVEFDAATLERGQLLLGVAQQPAQRRGRPARRRRVPAACRVRRTRSVSRRGERTPEAAAARRPTTGFPATDPAGDPTARVVLVDHQHVGGDPFEERPVVADDDDGARPLLQHVLQAPAACRDRGRWSARPTATRWAWPAASAPTAAGAARHPTTARSAPAAHRRRTRTARGTERPPSPAAAAARPPPARPSSSGRGRRPAGRRSRARPWCRAPRCPRPA